MHSVILKTFSNSQHTIQVLTGFQMLQAQGILNIELVRENREDVPHPHFVEAIVDGKRIAFDTADGYENMEAMNRSLADKELLLYFKRSFSGKINQQLSPECAKKLRPLGLYYYTTYDGSVLGRGGETGLRRNLKILMGKDMPMCVHEFENRSWDKCHAEPKILFTVRLWNPDTAKAEADREERAQINELRLGVIRELKKKYPRQFFGGVSADAFSESTCPELILPSSITKRRNYIRRMKNCDICISSMGLHASIGNKFAEYIAASRAIVCEKMAYEAPGDLTEWKNYLSYSSVEECLEKVDYLLAHRDQIVQMQQANHAYYTKYLRPDRMIQNALEQL